MSASLNIETSNNNDSTSTASSGFEQFDLHPDLMKGVRGAGFESPRPIQRETIPAGLDGDDVLGLAQTGTGKTAAFALPILDLMLEERREGPRALILAPTRELANQIASEIQLLAKFTRIKVVTIYGGVSARSQITELRRRPEIVVGCPGRVLDLLGQKQLKLDGVETLVLDEADHMFDMGFLPDIRKIVRALPRDRQNLLFSATMPKEIRGLADDLLYEPHVVELAGTAPAETVEHALYPISEQGKRDLLTHLLKGDDCDTAIVFTRTKHRAKRLAQQLERAGHRAVGLQGNMSQSQRDRAMRGFREGKFDIMVATDIVARGIDVSGISHVINYDVPNTPEAYTHRIGRTGRSECEGIACTFITNEDRDWIRATERMIGEKIPRRQIEGFAPDDVEPTGKQTKSNGRGRGSRPAGQSRGRRQGSRGRSRRGSSASSSC